MAEWFFTSDLHGQGALYEQAAAYAAEHRPAAMILGGDLCPHASGPDGPRRQRLFLEGFFVEFARRVREASPGTELLLLMGNDDWRANLDVLEAHDGELWRLLHGRCVEVNGTRVAGISWVPITPFKLKDWERWDDGGEEAPLRLDGFLSREGGLVPHRFDPARKEPTIADALETLVPSGDPGPRLLVAHTPPRDTHCDLTAGRVHVGSRALRRWIEREQPALVLSGHIHESPRVSSAWRDRIGATEVVNPGQFGTARLCGAWFDPSNPAGTLRHTVHG